MNIVFKPIGYIKSSYDEPSQLPRQSILNNETKGSIELKKEYSEGLYSFKKGDYIVVLFYLHLSEGYKLKQTSGHTGEYKGVFALRSPFRPNGVGMSIVKIDDISDNIITFKGVDMVNNTPVIDIKPYVPELNPTIK
jgi:tRNA-Thr(GGU) m(6)t(6)A37 methyltransferase TsaA